MDIYDRINELLIKQKMNKRQMSIYLKIPYTTIANIFQRRSNHISIELTRKIANYLGTTLEYLVTGNEEYKYIINNPNNTITIMTKTNKKFIYKLNDDDLNAIKTILDKMDSKL